MKYKLETIFEISHFLTSLEERESSALMDFLNSGRNASTHRKVFGQIASISGHFEPRQHQFVAWSDSNRDFWKFKDRVLEFGLVEESHLSNPSKDQHTQEQLMLQRKILAAQIAFEKGKVHLALEQLKRFYQRAKKAEMLRLQVDCADRISQYSRHLGDHAQARYWQDTQENDRFIMMKFRDLARQFNEISEDQVCCPLHCIPPKRELLLPFQMLYKSTGLLKVKWMTKYLRAECNRHDGKVHQSQLQMLELLRMLKMHPTIFSSQYHLLSHQFLLENMVTEQRYFILRSKLFNFPSLDQFPIYQRFPIYRLFMFEQVRLNRPDALMHSIEKLESDITLRNFIHIQHQLSFYRLIYFVMTGQYQSCLSLLNRGIISTNESCATRSADIRVIELICLFETGKEVLFFDRLESFRKYITRNHNGHTKIMYGNIQALLLGMQKRHSNKVLEKFKALNALRVPAYSYPVLLLKIWMTNRYRINPEIPSKNI